MFLTNLNLVLQSGKEMRTGKKKKNSLNSTVASLSSFQEYVLGTEDEEGARNLPYPRLTPVSFSLLVQEHFLAFAGILLGKGNSAFSSIWLLSTCQLLHVQLSQRQTLS